MFSSSRVVPFAILGLCGLIAAGIAGFYYVRHHYRAQLLEPFQPSLQQYLACAPKERAPNEQGIKPGMIAVDVATSSLDHFYFELPDDLKAATPADVKTVVFLRWDKIETHKYSNGTSGYTRVCAVDVVDFETKALVKSADFQGTPPPSQISGRSPSGVGSNPSDKVVLFLQQNTPR